MDNKIYRCRNSNIEDVQAHLLVEVDGNDIDLLYKDCEKIAEVMEQFDCGEISTC